MKRLSMAMTALAVMGLMTMVSCRKPNVGNVPGEARTITFNATTESNGGSKTYLEGLDVKWSENDKINVNGTEFNLVKGENTTFGSFTGTVGAVSGGYLACYPAGATNDGTNITFTIDDEQDGDADFDSKLPMAAYTTNENGDLSFRNMANVLKLDLTGSQAITKIEVESTENLSGSFTVGTGLTATHVSTGDMTKKITINYATPLTLSGDPENPTEVYVVLPVFGSAESTVTVKFTGDAGVMTVGPKALKGSTTPNHRYNAPVEVSLVVPLYIPGDFTVSAGADGIKGTADDVKVNFAKGNLWADATDPANPVFHLEANQWGYMVGEYHLEDGYHDWVQSHVSHFHWSKDARVGCAADYEDANTEYGITPAADDEFFANTSLSVEGQTGWRTLSRDEWNYLLGFDPNEGEQTSTYGRTNALKLCKYVKLTVVSKDDVYGLVILPDGSSTSLLDGYDDEKPISEAFLLSNGAVFLPAAGSRFGTGVYFVGEGYSYWSSTPYGSDDAYVMGIDGNYRLYGDCVRLVR